MVFKGSPDWQKNIQQLGHPTHQDAPRACADIQATEAQKLWALPLALLEVLEVLEDHRGVCSGCWAFSMT